MSTKTTEQTTPAVETQPKNTDIEEITKELKTLKEQISKVNTFTELVKQNQESILAGTKKETPAVKTDMDYFLELGKEVMIDKTLCSPENVADHNGEENSFRILLAADLEGAESCKTDIKEVYNTWKMDSRGKKYIESKKGK